MNYFINILYLISSIFFILALRGLSSPNLARRGNLFAVLAMSLVIVATLLLHTVTNYLYILVALFSGGLVGILIAYKTHMKQLPQLIAFFHSLVGLAASIIAVTVFYSPSTFGVGEYGNIYTSSLIEMSIGIFIGVITFAGSLIAFLKLQGIMKGNPIVLPWHNFINLGLFLVLLSSITLLTVTNYSVFLWLICGVSFIFGVLLIIPIGGADMPVIVSMLNSYSGWATAGIGFTLKSPVLVIVGALVGASGAILSYIMCKGMNRSILSVIFGATLNKDAISFSSTDINNKSYKSGSGEDAAYIMKNASSVIIVPGYGMAVSSAQYALKVMAVKLKEAGVSVKYAIHPVAGRMPGHMNVLLAEAGIPYEDVFEMENINTEFGNTDVVYIIGANDVTNPAAKSDPSSPIYGMPVLDVVKAKTIFFVKRTMRAGYSGIDNALFYNEKTIMLLGDAKAVTETIIHSLDNY